MTRPVIAVLDDWEGALSQLVDWSAVRGHAELHFHRQHLTGEALLKTVESADVVVLNRDRTPFDAPLVAAASRLRYLVFTGPRIWKIAYPELAARGIPVSGTDGGPALESTCEHTWALILTLARRLEDQFQLMRRGGWRHESGQALANVLSGQRLGLIGCGRIGTQVAAVAKAFGMEVVTWSPNMTSERAASMGVTAVSLEHLLQTSLVVSLHLVPSDTTLGLINAPRIALMRRDALLVNTARPELVDMDALADALRTRRIAAAAMDVFAHEPLAADDPLRQIENLALTPHPGFGSKNVYTCFAEGVRECLVCWLKDLPLPRQVLTPNATD